MIVRELAAFLAFSLIWLPLTGLFIWGFFLILKHTKLPRAFAILISCAIVAVCLHFLESARVFDKNDVYELIDVGVWLVVGMLFWGKSKRVVQTKAD
jgi:hypothetical protein